MRELTVTHPRGTSTVHLYGTGQAILLVPGGSAACEGYFPYLRDGLAKVGTVIEHDRPGTGSSGIRAGDLQEQAADLAAVIESADAGPAVVVGHSLGGPVSVQLAVDRPELVRGLVLIDPTPFNDPKLAKTTVSGLSVTAALYRIPGAPKALDALVTRSMTKKLERTRRTPEIERAIALFDDREEIPRLKVLLRTFLADAADLTPRLTTGLNGVVVTADRTPSSAPFKAHQALANATGLDLERWPHTSHEAHVQEADRVLDTVLRVTRGAVAG